VVFGSTKWALFELVSWLLPLKCAGFSMMFGSWHLAPPSGHLGLLLPLIARSLPDFGAMFERTAADLKAAAEAATPRPPDNASGLRPESVRQGLGLGYE
jgi:hypothetical protein